MWVLFAVLSSVLLGFYDVFKKDSLNGNAVIPVLLLNCMICSAFFIPLIVGSMVGWIDSDSRYYVPEGDWTMHRYVIIKAALVLSSWICGYFAIKNLPLTIVGPINATRPVLTLIGAMLIFGERLNALQWVGVCIAVFSFFALSHSGKKEGINFKHNKWIAFLIAAALIGAICGLYDKYLLSPASNGGVGMNRFFAQGWYNFYQSLMMAVILLTMWLPERKSGNFTPFRWKWSIPMVSVCLTGGDMSYMYALTYGGAMISIVSMIRRSSVLVSFIFGAIYFKEKNLKGKALDLLLVLVSLAFLLVGTLVLGN